MNKKEKLIALLFGAALVGWFFWKSYDASNAPATDTSAQVQSSTAPVTAAQSTPAAAPVAASAAVPAPVEQKKTVHAKPEKTVILKNALTEVEFSTWGATAKKVVLLEYGTGEGVISASNPPVCLDFSSAPAFALGGVENVPADADYEIVSTTSNSVTFANSVLSRTFTLKDNYSIELQEKFVNASGKANSVSLGVLFTGTSNYDMLSVDSFRPDVGGGEVVHHSEDDALKGLLVSGAGGCGGAPSGINKESVSRDIPGSRTWVAVKNRFFVAALTGSTVQNSGFGVTVKSNMASQQYAPESLSAAICFPTVEKERTINFYIGPKKQSYLSDLGMKEVMEYGMWSMLCYPLVWFLNACCDIIPNFGVAILILTLLIRIVFWPLTHKSTVSMRKMQEIQPKIKELREKFKDNPQRMNMEMMALYRENKVNPMASCLPMLVQIPVFIALFTVLRSAVELRYASFLWISDLSEPERLFPEMFSAIGGLNILPILMAVTMGLQSAMTPGTGDQNQRRMMMIMMPAVMLFMFYSFPSALSLYWTASQLLSILQTWMIRRNYKPAADGK